MRTRPDTRQDSRGGLGRSSNEKTARNSKMWRIDGPTDGPTDLPTDTARRRVACPRLKRRFNTLLTTNDDYKNLFQSAVVVFIPIDVISCTFRAVAASRWGSDSGSERKSEAGEMEQ